MGALDDHDVSVPSRYSPAANRSLFNKTQAFAGVLFSVGTEDARRGHTHMVCNALHDALQARPPPPLRALTVAGSGDQTLTWVRALMEGLSRAPGAPEATVHAVDMNPYQLDMARLKYLCLRHLSCNETMAVLYGQRAGGCAPAAPLGLLLSKAAGLLHEPSYWEALRGELAARGLLSIGSATRWWENFLPHFLARCLPGLPPAAGAAAVLAAIERDRARQVRCWQEAVSDYTHFSPLRLPSGYPAHRESTVQQLLRCWASPASWFCRTLTYQYDPPAPPPWLEAGCRLPPADVRLRFERATVIEALDRHEDGSLFFMELTNIVSGLPPDGTARLLGRVAAKLSPRGVAMLALGPLSMGVCAATGGDMRACLGHLTALAAAHGLYADPRWDPQDVGEGMGVYYVVALGRQRAPRPAPQCGGRQQR